MRNPVVAGREDSPECASLTTGLLADLLTYPSGIRVVRIPGRPLLDVLESHDRRIGCTDLRVSESRKQRRCEPFRRFRHLFLCNSPQTAPVLFILELDHFFED